MFRYLSQHPFHVGPLTRKEIHYFDRNYDRGESWYRAHFPTPSRRAALSERLGHEIVLGEATPAYLSHPLAPGRMNELMQTIRLVALLRNPVDRAFSQYRFEVAKGAVHRPFEEVIAEEAARIAAGQGHLEPNGSANGSAHGRSTYLARGIYVDQLERWMSLFSREQILVLCSEHLFDQPDQVFRQVLSFVGLPDLNLPSYGAFNTTRGRDLGAETRDELVKYFRPHNERLFGFLGGTFPWDE